MGIWIKINGDLIQDQRAFAAKPNGGLAINSRGVFHQMAKARRETQQVAEADLLIEALVDACFGCGSWFFEYRTLQTRRWLDVRDRNRA